MGHVPVGRQRGGGVMPPLDPREMVLTEDETRYAMRYRDHLLFGEPRPDPLLDDLDPAVVKAIETAIRAEWYRRRDNLLGGTK